ncbi:SufE family protein [Candidatus Spongiihabitans sp.]|uniref:SufE family protein n=1 Tax=Candidatus Spongiihabitans sp. TaxID=3101308 RepID=UPI003C6EDF6E
MFSINEIQDQIIEEFGIFDQWTEKYEYIIDLGKKMPLIDEQYKHDRYLVPGCQSRVWLHATMAGDKVSLTADSDAIITKGIIALLIRVLSDQPVEQISQADLYFIDKIGLKEHLSPTRSNGLVNMVAKIKSTADTLKRYH